MQKFNDVNQRYGNVMSELIRRQDVDPNMQALGNKLDQSEILRSLCLLCARATSLDAMADIVAGYLAASWTLNVDFSRLYDEELTDNANWLPRFPKSYGIEETRRWELTNKQNLQLSTFLRERIGICWSYAWTLAIVMAVSERALFVSVEYYVHPTGGGHIFVRADGKVYDLSARSHGHDENPPADADIHVIAL